MKTTSSNAEDSAMTRVVPFWYRTPKEQLERARQLWPDLRFPEPPTDFIPKTEDEVLLLHVPRSFAELWYRIGEGSDQYATGGLWVDAHWMESLELAPGIQSYRRPVWLAFDPDHGRHKRLGDFYDQDNMAASEVLSAIIQFPEWPMMWVSHLVGPCMAGYRWKDDERESMTLAMYLSTNTDPKKLEPYRISKYSDCRVLTFPSVRRV